MIRMTPCVVQSFSTTTTTTTTTQSTTSTSTSSTLRCHLTTTTTCHTHTQVVSDVDDTLKSSGGVQVAGVALGGIDTQYSRGEVYPGVAEFMLYCSLGAGYDENSNHNNNNNNPKQQQQQQQTITPAPAKVAILTARAEEFKLALKLQSSSPLAMAFRRAGEAAGVPDWVRQHTHTHTTKIHVV